MAWQGSDYVEPEFDPYAYAGAVDYDVPVPGIGLHHTGDPIRDLELERDHGQRDRDRGREAMPPPMPPQRAISISDTAQAYSIVPDPIRDFIRYFYNAILARDITVILRMYEIGFPKLSESFFKSSPWPSEQHIRPLLTGATSSDALVGPELFLVLYKELYYRHVYAKLSPTPAQRFESFENYCTLFSLLLSNRVPGPGEKEREGEGQEFYPLPLELPEQWLWDMLDEFLYQFQSYCQFRAKNLTKKAPEELDHLIAHSPKLWNVFSVLNILHSFVDRSRTMEQLQAYAEGRPLDQEPNSFGHQFIYRMLGYFSLVSLLRLNTLLGDYHHALSLLRYIQLSKQSQYCKVESCHITTYYYAAMCYLMMARYTDAANCLTNALINILRTKQLYQKNTLFESINKQADQMYILLAMSDSLQPQPQRFDEALQQQINERLDRLQHQRGTDLRDKQLEYQFQYAAPKFISPVAPNYEHALALLNAPNTINQSQFDSLNNALREPHLQQQRVFIETARPLEAASLVRSYLKLYTTLPLSKLSSFMNLSEDKLRLMLMSIKAKQRSKVSRASSGPLEGEWSTQAELDFYLDRDMVYIADTKLTRRYNEYFVRQIGKLDELQRGVRAAEWRVQAMNSAAAAAASSWAAAGMAQRMATGSAGQAIWGAPAPHMGPSYAHPSAPHVASRP